MTPIARNGLLRKLTATSYLYRIGRVSLLAGLLAPALLSPVTATSELTPAIAEDSAELMVEPEPEPEPEPRSTPSPDGSELPGKACPVSSNPSTLPMSTLTKGLVQAVSWFEKPETSLGAILQSFGPSLAAQLAPSPWPEINERARLARVPILMYHDILPEKEVFFDVTPEEFEQHLQLIQENGLTPITMDQLVTHLRTGLPLPEKPVMLTFDDGYKGHYEHVLPLLRKYGYPGLFSIYTYKVDRDHGRPGLTWAQVQEMASDPLVTIAAHSVMHPPDLRELSDADLEKEVVESRQILEEKLDIPIRYFTYPEGKYDERVADVVRQAGFDAALTMNDAENLMAGDSVDLLAIDRIGQSQIEAVLPQAWGGPRVRRWGSAFDFAAPIRLTETTIDDVPLLLISGGKPVTIHADSRYQVQEIIAGKNIEAAVDGGFFSLKYLDSNVMVGPVLSQNGGFVPGNPSENPLLTGRPLVLIGPNAVRFTPFDASKHNTLEGIQAEMADVTDAFVAAAWLVKDGQPQPPRSFGSLFDFDARRHRAFWGINEAGQPTIGVSASYVDSVSLGDMLFQSGLRDAVMLDSGASTSLVYQGESLVGYVPRPVPHVVGLVPSTTAEETACQVATTPVNRSQRSESIAQQ